MKYYSLLRFLNEPVDQILDSEIDYCYEEIIPFDTTSISDNSISSIVIPIIQRDYAQGREDNLVLLKEFLSKMFTHLQNRKQLKLDFIYGSLDRNKNNTFLPLDGQQRLTTLYLLHWYIIKVETKDDSSKFEIYRDVLSKFSYETRDTSRRFFVELLDFKLTDNPKEDIVKEYWYSDHFALDPTVKGILNTLDLIHQLYTQLNCKDLLEALEQEVIVFYVLLMDEFNLTDDLYIKLNARGKILSSFENLKADLVGFIKGISSFDTIKKLPNGLKMTHSDIIATNIDNSWADLFWYEAKKYLSKDEEIKIKNSVDTYFFRFIHRLLINSVFVSTGTKDEIFKNLTDKEEKITYTNFEFYKSLITPEFILDLEKILDFYMLYNNEIQDVIYPFGRDNKWSIYKESYTMSDRMLFYAINQYVLKIKDNFNLTYFKNWIRIVWNLISDPDVRSDDAYRSVMSVINLIAPFSNNIYESLKNGDLDTIINSLNNIHKEQLIEERLKAKLILEDAVSWEALILEAEAHKLYEGNIGFILNEQLSADQFKERFKMSCMIFNGTEVTEFIDNQKYSLMRYVISTHTDYDELVSFNFLSTTQNWQTHLRRDPIVRQSILNLILLNDVNKIKVEIATKLMQDSAMKSAFKVETIAHTRLYQEKELHSWMQENNVNKLRLIGEDGNKHVLAVRSGAWYDKVMLDGFRHKLITDMISHYKLVAQNRQCGESGFYWGDSIDFIKEIKNDLKVSFHFDIHNWLHIGLWGGHNSHIHDKEGISKDGWKQIYSFNVNDLKDDRHIELFISDIDQRIKSDPDCLFMDLYQEI
ncbi:DUF262 domain-containing protein [Myroides odoratus]|uniref:Protein of uncharacterized function DUF262 n=1 Tax=Myroides odoratus TaxID=256 RepID=A0A378RIW4_MYROD|nr:DUF262 domain-containing protein [Myroides odoratus]QQU02126.1 DUF262 domain-containing protein [Myroides odoratus]STZ26973.1 Protein of uncharacterised function DUF262 [Myroides odoratus]